MFKFVIHVDDKDVSEGEVAMQGLAVLEAVIAINMMHLRRHPEDVCVLASGKIKYDTRNKSLLSQIGDIRTIPALLANPEKGLCIDIIGVDVSIHRFQGRRAWPAIIPQADNGVFHVVTELQTPNGVIQYDPSLEIEQSGRAYSGQPSMCRVG
jgi:hypothetical protein